MLRFRPSKNVFVGKIEREKVASKLKKLHSADSKTQNLNHWRKFSALRNNHGEAITSSESCDYEQSFCRKNSGTSVYGRSQKRCCVELERPAERPKYLIYCWTWIFGFSVPDSVAFTLLQFVSKLHKIVWASACHCWWCESTVKSRRVCTKGMKSTATTKWLLFRNNLMKYRQASALNYIDFLKNLLKKSPEGWKKIKITERSLLFDYETKWAGTLFI